jgi:cell division protein FtsI (penicillin-binding protein 3)
MELEPDEKIAGTMPAIKAGNQQDLLVLCSKLGLKYESYTGHTWVYARSRNDSLKFLGNTIQPNVVPNVTGMTIKDAIFILENQGYKVMFSGRGKVVGQSELAGTRLNKGSLIMLRLG